MTKETTTTGPEPGPVRARFTDQKPRVATEKDLSARWGGGKPGARFRCYLCGHRYRLGDYWRWVYGGPYGSFTVCRGCDGDDVFDRWAAANAELRTRFWWAQ